MRDSQNRDIWFLDFVIVSDPVNAPKRDMRYLIGMHITVIVLKIVIAKFFLYFFPITFPQHILAFLFHIRQFNYRILYS